MNEIATHSMILSKVGLGTSGTECPTKTTIIAIDELITIDNANTYGSKETVRIRDIRKREITSSYVLNVTPTSMAFPATGGTKSYTVESYKNTTIEGQGTVKEDIPWTATISGTGFSNTNSDVTVTANNSAERTGSLLITLAESKKAAYIILKLLSAEISYNYYFTVTPTSMNFSVNGGNQSFTVTSYKKLVINGIEQPREIPVEYSSTISGTGFSVSGTTVIAATNSSGKRTGEVTITQAESNKVGIIELSQDGVELPWVYTFKISPWESSIGNQGGTTSSFTITSTKTKEGVTLNVDWSIDTTTVPSWVTFNQSNMTFTVAANNAAARNVNIKFKQAESGNTDIYRINLDGVVVTTVFAANPSSFSFVANGGSGVSAITSTKNGTEQGWSITKVSTDWITATKDSSNVNVSVTENYTKSSRTGTITLTQSESNKTATITVNQKVSDEWIYTFEPVGESKDKPTRITTGLSYSGLDTTYTMYSYKQRSLNGIIVDDTLVGVNVTYTVDYPSEHNCTIGTLSADKTKWMIVIQLPYTSSNPSLTTEYGTFTATQDSSGNIFKIDFMLIGDTDFRIGTYNLNKTSSSDTRWYGTDLIVYKEGSSDQTNGSQLFLTYVEINIDTDKLAEEGYTLVSRTGTPSSDRFINRFSCPYTLGTTANWFTTRFESEDKYGRLYFIFPENTGSTRNATVTLSQNTPSVDITGCEVYENTPQEFNFTVTQNAGN